MLQKSRKQFDGSLKRSPPLGAGSCLGYTFMFIVNSKLSLCMKTIDLVVLSLMRDLILCHESKKEEYLTHPYYTWVLLLYQQSKISHQ